MPKSGDTDVFQHSWYQLLEVYSLISLQYSEFTKTKNLKISTIFRNSTIEMQVVSIYNQDMVREAQGLVLVVKLCHVPVPLHLSLIPVDATFHLDRV